MPMNTVLVVEDEKLIRQGICAMVRRGPVHIDRVLECRNGLEAMQHLDREPVDLVITDLRMPKMDGMELVRRMDALPRHPLVVVVSGYDDFDYVSGMLRMGVRDYILKPVERERMYQLLARMEEELEAESSRREVERLAALQVVRAALLGQLPDRKALDSAALQLAGDAFWARYRMVCLWEADRPEEPRRALELGVVEGQAVLLADEPCAAALLQGREEERCAGLSAVQSGWESLYAAYLQARSAREHAWLRGRTVEFEAHSPAPDPLPAEGVAEQLVQLLGTGKADEAGRVLGEALFLAQNSSAEPAAFLDCVALLREKLAAAYAVFPEVARELDGFADPLAWRSAYACYTDLGHWMQRFCENQTRVEDNQNQHKIQAAVEYLHQHYTEEIDMAVVSNHVSMNYSQFSTLFKRYTGRNFQDYLRGLRIEKGKQLLRETDLAIRQVSEQSGFKNEKHFMKAFKQTLAVSPTEYRSNQRGTAAGPGEPT